MLVNFAFTATFHVTWIEYFARDTKQQFCFISRLYV